MKALSLHPYYAVMIAAGEKTIEYRSWRTDYRGPLIICSSRFNDGPQFPRGYALCAVDLRDITGGNRKYEWHPADVTLIDPFPVKGRLHLFDVPDEKLSRLCWNDTWEPFDFDAAYEYWISQGLCSDPDELEN